MKYPLINEDYRPEAVVLASGDYPRHPVPLHLLDNAPYLCCCDGAAVELLEHAITPQAIVGDGDSLPAFFREHYTGIVHIYSEQEDNDLTKATCFCMAKGYRRIAYLGATGKREDHTLGNISLLARYRTEMQLDVTMITDHGYFVPIRGYAELESFKGQQVSIFNLGCSQISAEGLKWEPYAYQQWWQGTLNEATGQRILLHGDGNLVVFRTYNRK